MVSVKVKFRPSAVIGQEGCLYYQIILDRKVRQVKTDLRIFPCEWNQTRGIVKMGTNPERNLTLDSIRFKIRTDIERINRIDRQLTASGIPYTAEDISYEFHKYSQESTLFTYMADIIVKLKKDGKIRTSETYRSALNSFRSFRQNADILLDCITSDLMESFQAWHRQKGNAPNTISFFNRILRAVYNRAVESDVTPDRHPFRRVYTGVEKTVKRAISLSLIRNIRDLDLPADSRLDYARNMFLLSFFLRGMSFIDMAFLKKTDLKNGYIIYRRRKTGQILSIAWTKEMQAILDRYPPNPTQYLLPIIRTEGINERCAYRNTCYHINQDLKEIAALAGIGIPLTMYVARHSWASAAKNKGVPLSVISEGMGHDSESTTRIYLASLDNSAIDRANSLILQSI